MNFNPFYFTTEFSTAFEKGCIGVEMSFFYGSIDGVDIGSAPSDTQLECIEHLDDVINRCVPYRLEQWLDEDLAWTHTAMLNHRDLTASRDLYRRHALLVALWLKLLVYRSLQCSLSSV